MQARLMKIAVSELSHLVFADTIKGFLIIKVFQKQPVISHSSNLFY